jgi:hypothetical protein
MLSRLALLFAILPATVFGATTQEIYQKLWAKRSMNLSDPDTLLKPKAACVCQDGSIYHGRAGALVRDGTVPLLWCFVPFFSAEGILAGYHTCVTYEYIGK